MTQVQFQEHVLKELAEMKSLFIRNEQDHSNLSKDHTNLAIKKEQDHKELSIKIESLKSDVRVLTSKFNWLLTILSPVATAVLVGLVKVIFFK